MEKQKQKIKETYNPQEKEGYWQKFWEDEGINNFDPESPKELFTIDTPPPTISGALHLGHVYSYTQAEVIARYRRLAGFNVRYPMGFDNNGLPTERLVEKEKKIQGRKMPLAEFVKICLEVTDEYREKYENLWKSLGLSVDWRLTYFPIISVYLLSSGCTNTAMQAGRNSGRVVEIISSRSSPLNLKAMS